MTPFAQALAARIRSEGPLRLDAFIAACNAHYYATRDPFGEAGDFITAPEISQMFGEMVALFLAQSWQDQGAPEPVQIVELGPGRGTLMADLRRTLSKAAPGLARAAQIHLIEQSPHLRALQESRLGPDIHWHSRFEDVPPRAALLLIANEFFDALPIRQFIRTAKGWQERSVGLDESGRFCFAAAHSPANPFPATQEGAFLEACPEGAALIRQIAERLRRSGGTALILDYGHAQSAAGETLQAVKAHKFVSPLAEPGEADLTAHVDFEALARAAGRGGAEVHGPVTQGAFLTALGIRQRAKRLEAGADAAMAVEIEAALARLTGEDQMGSLFKVMALTRFGAPRLAGF